LGVRIYYSYKILQQKTRGISFALKNGLKCPEINCKFIDANLPIPDINSVNFPENVDILVTSKFIANTIGKISNNLSLPENVIGKYNYSGKLFGVLILDTKNSALYIVFRGTRTWDEWKQDFNFVQIINDFTDQGPLPGISLIDKKLSGKQEPLPLSKKQLGVLKISQALHGLSMDAKTPMIHRGFLNIYNSFKNQLISDIDKYPNHNVIIGGHSLGSAISSILAMDLATRNTGNIMINVFASPRIGDSNFTNAFISMNNMKYVHWCNLCDIIPTVPLAVMPNLDLPNEPYFYMPIPSSVNSRVISFEKNWLSLENNHTLPLYIEYLSEYSSTLL